MNRQDHLSEQAMDDVLMGLGSSHAEAHLAGCDACREKLEQFRADVGLLDKASLAWNEARASCMPARAIPAEQPASRTFGMWATGAAGCVLLAAGALLIADHETLRHNQPATIASSSQGSGGAIIPKRELREDNALMMAIYQETAPIPSPLIAYEKQSSIAQDREEAAKP